MFKKAFSPASRLRSVGFALRGIVTLVSGQPNALLHVLATVLVVLAAWHWRLYNLELAMLALAIGLVWSMEAMNTAIELLCDKVEPSLHPQIKAVKDVAAAGVLLAAGAAAVVGLVIFLPYWL